MCIERQSLEIECAGFFIFVWIVSLGDNGDASDVNGNPTHTSMFYSKRL